ncbi:phosphate ABC transporter permease family protein [Thalassotalea sp. LPB0316]|uniref:phosphate ABC transporter permease family protein n=1 Tax=Thalassotalea sp. LPB0316 TaxID=2769490 RepID=UPI00186692F8|nr:phosphate ABC transporter permease family protein [Thalassotalea sp. LPB0316]QOL26783.1 phosphate ABC transporter permease family protein [Thalassotalea sp. LPB0316]
MSNKVKSALKRLNPKHSLFGKLFLWFWLATIVLISSTVWLSRQFSDDNQIRPVSKQQQQVLTQVFERVEQLNQRKRKPRDLKKLAFHLSRQFNYAIVIYDIEEKKWFNDLPTPTFRGESRFERMLAYDQALAFNVGRFTFAGPTQAMINDKSILIYVGQHRAGGALHSFKDQHPGWFIAIILTISALLCLVMAWTLNKPLKALQQTVQQMASGDLSARVANADKRHDEVGKLSQDINHMAEQVDSLVSSQKRLLADISHELRSPLARLQIAIGIAQQSSADSMSEAQLSSLTRIEKEADEIETMISQVLALSRLEANQQQQAFEQVNLSSLVSQLCQDAQFEADAQSKALVCQVKPGIELNGDGQLLSRAFENLIRNAIKYAQQTIQVVLEEEDKTIHFFVQDDGGGVNDEEIDKIFTPFYRASASRNRQSGGVGLGLAITRSAISAHNGSVTAENAEPQGLKVSVRLPKVH